MLNSRVEGKNWTVNVGGRDFLLQSEQQPFAIAVKREKTYQTDRGVVKEEVRETARVALSNVREETNGRVALEAEGRRLLVELSEDAGVLSFAFTGEEGWAYEFFLPCLPGENVFGGGEQYRQVNLKGERVVNFVSEHIKAKTVIEKGVLPKALYREKKHSEIGSYAPMPLFVTDRFLLVYFETPSDGYTELVEPAFHVVFDACPEKMRLFVGHDFRDVGRKLATLVPNRQFLPDWCYDGMILGVQGGTETILKKAFAMQDAGAKVSAIWSQDWSGFNRTVMGYQVWWNWEVDSKLYHDLKDAIRQLNERGIRFLGYINPYLVQDSTLYNECKEKGYLIKRENGEIYHIKSTTFNAGMLDLTNPEVVRYIKEKLIRDNMIGLGISGWMADFGEYLPVDAVLHDGDPKKLHNVWPLLWSKLNREAIEEFGKGDEFFFVRSGYLGVQSYAPILWNGDQHTDLTHDYGMPCIMPASFALGFSGVTLVHSDIGGFFSFLKMKRDPELFTRWMEMCTFSILMRSHESIRPWANAQFDHPDVLPYFVRLTNIHAALKPYLKTLEEGARQGLPVMRPDFYEAGSFASSKDPYAYFLGDDMFVCPVIERKAKTRKVFLPAGEWVGFFDGKTYAGGTSFEAPAPLGETPVFYRKGSAFRKVFEEASKIR